jgi:hypothetical protein
MQTCAVRIRSVPCALLAPQTLTLKKHVVDHAVAHFVSAVDRLSSITPLFVRDSIR